MNWIDVDSDDLPLADEEVIVCTGNFVFSAWYNGRTWLTLEMCSGTQEVRNVLYWQPYPRPPERNE